MDAGVVTLEELLGLAAVSSILVMFGSGKRWEASTARRDALLRADGRDVHGELARAVDEATLWGWLFAGSASLAAAVFLLLVLVP